MDIKKWRKILYGEKGPEPQPTPELVPKMSEKEKKALEDEFVETGDIGRLVKREVNSQLRPFVTEFFHEQERTAKKQDEIIKLIKNGGCNRIHATDVVQYVWLIILTIAMLTLQGG